MNRRKKGLTFGHYCIFFYIFIRQVRFLTIFAQFFVFVKMYTAEKQRVCPDRKLIYGFITRKIK